MPIVTRDAAAGKWIPQSAAEAVSLYANSTVAIPAITALWLCQEDGTAGHINLADSVGANNLVSNGIGAAAYAQPVAGWTSVAVVPTAGSVRIYSASSWPDASTTVFAVINYPAGDSTGNPFSVLTIGGTFGAQVAANLRLSTTPTQINLATSGPTDTAGANNTVGVHPTVLSAQKTATLGVFQTELETLSHATLAANSFGAVTFGGDNSQFWTDSGAGYLHAMAWSGATAEFTATQRATLIDRYNNGPAVVSIAVTPTSFTLSPLGATQQMTATATRADGSTYDCTATATWVSGTPGTATISATGLVTAIAVGTSNITAAFTSFNAATATSPAQVVTVTSGGGGGGGTGLAPNGSLLTFIRFDEPLATVNPSDAIASLTDLTPTGTMPTVVNAFCGFGRLLGNGLAFTATDVQPGFTLATRDVTVQAILSWDMPTQVALATDGTIVARGKGNTAGEYVSYAMQLHVVNSALQIGELSLWWQDTSGGVHVEQGGQFLLPPPGQFMMLTAVRHWIDATHVEVRYYAGDQLLAEFASSDGDIGGGTTGTMTVGARYSGGVAGNYFCGVIDELRVLNYEITAEEISATWARISNLQPRAYSAVKQLMQPGAPISNDPASRIQKLLRIVGHGLGYAVAQAENMRQNMLPDRAYGPVLEQHERITGEAPLVGDTVQKRRKRVVAHARQKAGVSIPGIAATVADLLAIGKTQVQVIAFDNTIRDDFSLGLRPTLWLADDPAQWAVSAGALHVTAAAGSTMTYDARSWFTCMASALGSRVSADGRPTAANDTTQYFDGRGAHILAKMSPTLLGADGESGVMFYDFAKNNVLLFGLRNTGSGYQVITEKIVNGVSAGASIIGLSALQTHWFHLWQNANPGFAAGNRFYNAAWSTTGPTSGYLTTPDFQHVASFGWMGFYLRTFTGTLGAGTTDVAFDDVIMRHTYGSRPFRFYVYRDPTLPGVPDLVGAELAVQRLQQAHTSGHVITTKVALCDTAGSGCDRTPMGGF